MQERPLAGSRLGIFGKGGSGKSTVTVFLAGALRRMGYEVAVLDADSTNVGLGKAFGLACDPDPLLEYFGGMVFSGGPVTCPVDDPLPLADASVEIDELPRRFIDCNADGVWVLVAGKLGSLGPGAGCDGPIIKIARDLRLRGLGAESVTLVDFKAGFEDPARGALTTLDWALTVVDPTPAAAQLAGDLARLVRDMRGGVAPATRHLGDARLVDVAVRGYRDAPIRDAVAIVNRADSRETEGHVRAALDRDDVRVVGALEDDAAIPRQWLLGQPLRSGRLELSALTLARALEQAMRREHRQTVAAGGISGHKGGE